ncbi:hypothetical protein GCM10009860_13530 [Microbacterium mitrae]
MPEYTTGSKVRNENSESSRASGAPQPFGHRKGAGAPVRRAFIERTDDSPSPLSLLLSGANASRGGGGRGGRLRVALVITLIWQLAKSPHTTIRPARYWAVLLKLEDPDRAGSRAIRSTLLEIERRGFIRTEERGPGKVPEIILRDESLRGVDYKLPYLQAIEEGAAGSTSYFRVPETFWSSGLCTDLSGAGLAMYLIAMSRAGWGNDPSFWLSPTLFRKEYGLGESTRKKGLKELVDRGVLTHELRSIDRNGESGHRRFVRSVYTIVSDYRAAGATEPLPPSPKEQPTLEELLTFFHAHSKES